MLSGQRVVVVVDVGDKRCGLGGRSGCSVMVVADKVEKVS